MFDTRTERREMDAKVAEVTQMRKTGEMHRRMHFADCVRCTERLSWFRRLFSLELPRCSKGIQFDAAVDKLQECEADAILCADEHDRALEHYETQTAEGERLRAVLEHHRAQEADDGAQ